MKPESAETPLSLEAAVFCPGPLGIYEQSLALQERGLLRTMATDLYADFKRLPLSALPSGRMRSFLIKRHHPPLEGRFVRTHWSRAILHQLRIRRTKAVQARDRAVFAWNDEFDHWVASHLPEFGNLAFGYESSSLHTFRRAKELGLPTVLYQPIGVAEFAMNLLQEEAKRVPKLAETLRYAWFPPAEITRRREERALADRILCASSFTKKTLIDVGVPESKIQVEPYGVDQSVFAPSQEKFPAFSIVWASSFTQTKGFSYLLESIRRSRIPGAELVLAGYPSGRDAVALYGGDIAVRRLGRLTRAELGKVMARSHVHVFPTLLDGFGRNIVEAMASGLPVITTPHGAGSDLIKDGLTGFVVPIRDVDAIVDKLRWVHAHPQEAFEMGQRARTAVIGLSQADYRRRFAVRIQEVFSRVIGSAGRVHAEPRAPVLRVEPGEWPQSQ
jgi:alpha-maltose-1-phosphate synthase